MVETKSPRVRIRFVANLRGAPSNGDDPLVAEANAEHSWLLEVLEPGQPTPLGSWPIWHPLRLPSKQSMKVFSIEQDAAAMTAAAQVERVREQIQLVVPELAADIFERLTFKQLIAIAKKCWEEIGEKAEQAKERETDAANPPGGERDSDSSLRSPAASTAGATAT